MRLELKFVGVLANDLLTERIREMFRERLVGLISEIESASLSIDQETRGSAEVTVGQGEFLMRDGQRLVVRTDNGKLMKLVESSVVRLQAHFDQTAAGLNLADAAGDDFPKLDGEVADRPARPLGV